MQIGFKCSFYGDVRHEDCRACSLNPEKHLCQYDPFMLENMRERRDPEREGIFSPTQLLQCFRKDVLLSGHDYYSKPEDSWCFERGNIVHSYMEQRKGKDVVAINKRIFCFLDTKYGKKRFGGKPDLITLLPDGTFQITDYKSMADISHDYCSVSDDHILQLNMYKFLVEQSYQVKVSVLELNAISMTKSRRFTSLQELKTRGKMTKRSEPKEYEEITLAKIPVVEKELMEKWVIERIEAKIESSLDNLPPPLWDTEESYKCYRCPVYQKCHEIEEKKNA